MENTKIHLTTEINAPIQETWEAYNNPSDIIKWNFASPDWHCPSSENDLKVGGKFKNKMAAKDGSFEFNFEGTYTNVAHLKAISYILSDNREVDIHFSKKNDATLISLDFDAEKTNPIEMQHDGWLSILTNFKKYVEAKNS